MRCSVEGCGREVLARGWCRRHYEAFRRSGDPLVGLRSKPGTCSEEGCNEPTVGRGVCRRHYARQWAADQRAANAVPAVCAYCGGPSLRKRRNGISYCTQGCKDKAYAESGQHAEYARKTHLRAAYGMTVEEFDAAAAKGCRICGTTEWGGKTGIAHVDHDHATPGSSRGLLCHNCNVGLGHFKDDPELLQAAIRYLSR